MRPLLVLLLALLSGPASAEPLRLSVKPTREQVERLLTAEGVLLMEAGGKVLFEREADRAFPPASTLKLLTALEALESVKLEDSVVIAAEDLRTEPVWVPWRVGDRVPVRMLMESLVVASHNDSALALARHAGGTVDAFVERMNKRARALGCRATRAVNPSGLPAEGQTTSARDLMRLYRAAMRNRVLHDIASMESMTLRRDGRSTEIANRNRMTGKFEGLGPAKSGWTKASRHTFVGSAKRNGREVWLALLSSEDRLWDAVLLFEFGLAAAE